jgi:hypothetical protein
MSPRRCDEILGVVDVGLDDFVLRAARAFRGGWSWHGFRGGVWYDLFLLDYPSILLEAVAWGKQESGECQQVADTWEKASE